MARAESGTLRTTASERTTCNARSSHARPADMRRAGETAASMRAADARPTNMHRTEGSAAVPAKPAAMSAKACEVSAATVSAAATVPASTATMPAASAAAGVCLECEKRHDEEQYRGHASASRQH
jgi:hypothetical protein